MVHLIQILIGFDRKEWSEDLLLQNRHIVSRVQHQMGRNLAKLIIEPLRNLAGVALPQIIAKLASIGEFPDERSRIASGLELGRSIDAKIQEMETILVQMQRLEGFTEIVKHLRAIIRTQTESASATREAYKSLIDDIFEDDLFEEDNGEGNK